METKLYTPKEVSDALGVSLAAVRKWMLEGKINIVYLPMSSRPLITQEELTRLQTPISERP